MDGPRVKHIHTTHTLPHISSLSLFILCIHSDEHITYISGLFPHYILYMYHYYLLYLYVCHSSPAVVQCLYVVLCMHLLVLQA